MPDPEKIVEDIVAEAHGETVDGVHRERFLFEIRADDLTVKDAGERFSFTPLGEQHTIAGVGRREFTDGSPPEVGIQTLEGEWLSIALDRTIWLNAANTRGHRRQERIVPAVEDVAPGV